MEPIDLTRNRYDMVGKSVRNRSRKSNNVGPLAHSKTPYTRAVSLGSMTGEETTYKSDESGINDHRFEYPLHPYRLLIHTIIPVPLVLSSISIVLRIVATL